MTSEQFVLFFSFFFLFVCPLQVTYRVVQVTEDQLEAAGDGGAAVSVVSTAAFAGAQQAVAQVVRMWMGRWGSSDLFFYSDNQPFLLFFCMCVHVRLYTCFFSLFCMFLIRLLSRTLSVTEGVRQVRRSGVRHVSPTSRLLRSATVQRRQFQCRQPLMRLLHQQQVRSQNPQLRLSVTPEFVSVHNSPVMQNQTRL